MASRSKEKERHRRERLAAEQAEAAARSKRRRAQLIGGGLLAAVVTAAVVAAASSGGGGGGSSAAGSAPKISKAKLRSLPPQLAANARQANQIIDTPVEEKLEELSGFPVVANQWGSWCPPCRAEFPWFAESAEEHLDEVAFIGLDIQDDRGAAEDFLAELPTPYPHIFDDDNSNVNSLGWTGVSPTTWLIDEEGEIVHQRPGAYASRADLEADIERFLLQG